MVGNWQQSNAGAVRPADLRAAMEAQQTSNHHQEAARVQKISAGAAEQCESKMRNTVLSSSLVHMDWSFRTEEPSLCVTTNHQQV